MMPFQNRHALQMILLSAALTLSACGGGGSSSATTNNTETPSSGGTSGGTTGSTTPSGGGGTPAPRATPIYPSGAAPALATAECPIGDYRSAMVAAIDAVRASNQYCGAAVGVVNWNTQLESAAARHSNDMAANNYWNVPNPHQGTDGSTIRERVPQAGYNYLSAGENVAAGQSSVSQVVADWVNSPSHCANIMTASFFDMAVSCKYNPSATYQYYWTLTFGNR